MSAQLIDHMGSDLSIVNAARVSFHKESAYKWEDHGGGSNDIPHLPDADAKLLNYLAKHGHWSPFAHTSLQFRIKAPMFVARQLVKHQVGGVWNEVSRRYVDDEPEFFWPDQWRGAPVNAKQGSAGFVDVEEMDWRDENSCDLYTGVGNPWHPISAVGIALEAYTALIKRGVAPEQARIVLPLNTMTEWIWTGSLYFFARVCKERMSPHAQKECGDVARLIDPQCRAKFPVSWTALREQA